MKKEELTIDWVGTAGGYYIRLNTETVHFCKSVYERDMFIAELKARIILIKEDSE